MKRRSFLGVLGGAAIPVGWPLSARAQRAGMLKTIAVLTPFAAGDAEGQAILTAFRQGLSDAGLSEGRNVRIEARWTGGDVTRASTFAKELAGQSPDIIFAYFNAQLAAVSHETKIIPIVFVGASDPVGAGYVASLPRPGGNITGFTLYEPSLAGKWLGLLKEIVPQLKRVTLMVNPDTAVLHGTFYVGALAVSAASFGVETTTATVYAAADIEAAIASLGGQPGSGLIVGPDTFTEAHGDLIVTLTARHRVPAVYGNNRFAGSGALVGYGPDVHDATRRAAAYVDRILRGEKPAELPVQAPVKFQTTVNVRTAAALGLTIPPGILVAADQVIE